MTDHVKIYNTRPLHQFIGNGSTNQFPYRFAIFSEDDLEVYLDNVQQSSGYTVSGIGSSDGGSVTFPAPPAPGVLVTLRRNLAIQRVTDFQESGMLQAKALNDELDYQTAALQDLAANLTLTLKLAPTDEQAQMIVPKRAERANKVLGFDGNGDLVTLGAAASGVTDHGALPGLADDDHPQYLSSGRADAWFGSKTTDNLTEGNTNRYLHLGGTGVSTSAARVDHVHTGVYEPSFAKNTAFNKNFGAAAGTVAEGNHAHALGDLSNVDESGKSDGYGLVWSSASGRWEPKALGAGSGGGLANAYGAISDGANEATATGSGTIHLRSSTGSMTPLVTSDDPTFGDSVDFNVVFAGTGTADRAARADHRHLIPVERVYQDPGTFTWSKPEGLRYVDVVVRGGGGGGGGNATASNKGGGGGGQGGLRRGIIPADDLPATVAVTVGTGGGGGSSGPSGSQGGAGGDSTFGAFMVAKGGQGGYDGDNVSGGNGGSHSGSHGYGIRGTPGTNGGVYNAGSGGGEGAGRVYAAGVQGGGGGGIYGSGVTNPAFAGGSGYALVVEHF